MPISPDVSKTSCSTHSDEGKPVLLLRGSILGLEAIKSLCRDIKQVSTLEEARSLAGEIEEEVRSLIKRHDKRVKALTSEQTGVI